MVTKVGGLAIPRLYLAIPVLRFNQINSSRSNNDSLIISMPNNIILKWSLPKFYDNIYLRSNNIIKEYHIEKLFNPADERAAF